MHKTFIFISLILTLTSCSEEFSRFSHRRTIPKNKFVSILAEIHIMEAITGKSEYYRKYSSKDTLDIYGPIIQKYGYSREQFDSTVASYVRKPEIYEKIYNEVLMKLNYMLDTLRKNDPMFERLSPYE